MIAALRRWVEHRKWRRLASRRGPTNSLLFQAVSESPTAVRAVLEAGADIGAMDGGDRIGVPPSRNLQGNPEGLNYRGTGEFTALHWAVDLNRADVVQVLLGAGAEVNAADGHGYTPLHWAVQPHVDTVIVEVLLQAGADVDARSTYPLRYAGGHESCGRISPLHWAAWVNNASAAKILLDAGADLESTDNDGQTPLLHAAASGGTSTVELLVGEGADVDAMSILGGPVIQFALMANDKRTVEILLEAGADVNPLLPWNNLCGKTLTSAVEAGATEPILDLLIRAGANVDGRNEYFRTPLHEVIDVGGRDTAVGDSLSVARMLLEAGADVNSPIRADRELMTPLDVARRKGQSEMAELLADAGALEFRKSVSSEDNDFFLVRYFTERWRNRGGQYGHWGETIREIQEKTVEVLLAAGESGNPVDRWGRTSLHRAAQCDVPAAILAQRAAGADEEVTDSAGMTPAHIAAIANAGGALATLVMDYPARCVRRDKYGYTPVHRAMSCLLPAEDFLWFGWDFMRGPENKRGQSPSHLAARYNREQVLALACRIELTVGHGFSMVEQDKRGRSPLHAAAAYGAVGALRVLVAAGADLDRIDAAGQTPLHLAAARGRSFRELEVMRMLLNAGADLNVADRAGRTPADLARQAGAEPAARLLDNFSVAGWPVTCDAQPVWCEETVYEEAYASYTKNRQSDADWLLLLAARENAAPAIEVLAAAGANPNVKFDSSGETALHVAVNNNAVQAIEALVAVGADLDMLDTGRRNTALHEAVISGNAEAAKALVRAGADREIPGYSEMRPIDRACYQLRDFAKEISDHKDPAELVKEYLAPRNVSPAGLLGEVAALKILSDADGWSSISGAASPGEWSLFTDIPGVLRRFIKDMGGRVRD